MASLRHLFRARTLGLLACLSLVSPALAWAQSADDAGADGGIIIPLPDASSGEGGPDRDNPEGEDGTGRVNTVCRHSGDCSARFTCDDGKCRYTGVRKAEQVGCLMGAEGALVLVGLAGLARPRRNRG
ncbi:hypothetical protein LXT21_11640 [Myxococcus sp. K38C18041901]|uniref:MXAN_6627.5 family MYXO-CTERM protein n=1 Tax=Myxococcus guangdongensis TaxID=2906760 RepID=UPI0020A74B41|nr:MXAN_6627.5 family MYXO-CTERM protein [Myxococcus guangdongensis]MCP3059428.1 hypothetical protein [Myxococcus guangdongensis]